MALFHCVSISCFLKEGSRKDLIQNSLNADLIQLLQIASVSANWPLFFQSHLRVLKDINSDDVYGGITLSRANSAWMLILEPCFLSLKKIVNVRIFNAEPKNIRAILVDLILIQETKWNFSPSFYWVLCYHCFQDMGCLCVFILHVVYISFYLNDWTSFSLLNLKHSLSIVWNSLQLVHGLAVFYYNAALYTK